MKKRDFIFIIIVLIILVIYAIFLNVTGIGIPCLIHTITGLYCPGCGISRMFLSIFKLDFYQAFRYNPIVFILSILFFITMIIEFIYYIINKKVFKINDFVYYIITFILITYGIMRNLSAFSYLLPTVVK